MRVNCALPAAVGVPLIKPLEDTLRPAGSAPPDTLTVTISPGREPSSGQQPPRPLTWSEYGVPMSPVGQIFTSDESGGHIDSSQAELALEARAAARRHQARRHSKRRSSVNAQDGTAGSASGGGR